jgi:serine protein kinase
MAETFNPDKNCNLLFHARQVLSGNRKFETASETVCRMILEKPVRTMTHAGRTVYDFEFFRQGKKHIIGWYEEINDFVHFVKDAAAGGSAREMAFVLIGEPGNGKTFFVDYICRMYRRFLAMKENRKYSFKFVRLNEALKYDPKVAELHSLTFEDPIILAMNLFEDPDESRLYLSKVGFSDNTLEGMYKQRRPLGASTEYLWHELLARYNGDVDAALEHVQVVPVPMNDSLGTVTGKYSAKDKITSSSVDLLGEESLQHLLLLKPGDPNRFDLRRGALARVAGSGIHFSDELFRNKKDLVQIYLQVIQNRNIELDGFIWPIDALIIATSNNDAYNQFVADKEEAPIKDRCRLCYVSHNTDYKLQMTLTSYVIGNEVRTTIFGDNMHEDPNLNYAASVAVILTRLTHSEKLSPIEMMKLAAGEIAGDKGVKTLLEVMEVANENPDVTKRWGQKGLGHRNLGRAIQILGTMPESNHGKCLFAKDVFKAFQRIVLDYVTEPADRERYQKDLETARRLYHERVETNIFNAYRDDPDAYRKDVMNYVNMIIGMGAESLGKDKMWRYKDPQTDKMVVIKIDESFISSVESQLGLNSNERKEAFRTTIRRIYGQKRANDPNYDFSDNQELVKAVTSVKLKSDVAGAGSLVGALANRTNEENLKLYNRMIETMFKKLGFCHTCAQKTIEYFCEKTDES